MASSDFAFANDIRAAIELRTPRTARMLLYSILALIVTGLVWAHFAILDEVKRGNGRVIPSRQTQVIQSLEGGLVQEILVSEGSIVKQNAPLVRIDDTNFSSQFGEVRERRAALTARVARLDAESLGLDKPVFPREVSQVSPRAVETELNLFNSHMRKLQQDIDVLSQQETQKRRELDEYRASENKLTQSLELTRRENQITRQLFKQKVIPEIEMIRIEQKQVEIQGQLDVVQQSMLKSEAAIGEIAARKATAIGSFRSQAGDDLAKSKSDLAVIEETIKAAQDKLSRTELRSPVYGVVNKLNVTTVGAVVQPGSNIMEIVPLDDTLLVEGRVRPRDIAFIRPGQDAVVKITAYDPYVYGHLNGRVERISADVIADDKVEKGETFYRIMVRTDKNFLGSGNNPLPIIPGMVATVEVLTGKKSVLDYLLKPARILRDEALREH